MEVIRRLQHAGMMPKLMPALTPSPIHQFHRHPDAPWLELRVSQPSAHCFRLHSHEEYSIGIIDQGEAVFHQSQGPQLCRQGNVVLIEPGRWHACNPEQPANWAYRMLFINADWLHAQLQTRAIKFKRRLEPSHHASEWAHRLCTPLMHMQDVAQHTQGLLQFLNRYADCQRTQTDHSEPAAVRDVLQTLHNQPDSDISVQALAAAQGMSASRFIRLFKAATGVTPGAYRLNLRVNGARRLLAQGTTLAQAAHSMGFADQAHLQRSFKTHHALTPGNYAQSATRHLA